MKKILIALVISGLTIVNQPSSFAAAKAGGKCSKVGATKEVKGVKLTCAKSGSKLKWSKEKSIATTIKDTVNQINAKRQASTYLSFAPFSRTGLIAQLEFEGFSNSDATYGADSIKANWKEQAVKAAKNYLDLTAFSRSGLIEQLEYEGYTTEEATYGVDKTGLE
jgi:hypothetical protein